MNTTALRSGIVALGLIVAGCTQAALASEITIGTASRAGIYYHVGRAICRVVNEGTPVHGIRCRAPSTDGSIANLKDLRAGILDLATVQSDWQFHAVDGSSKFEAAGPDPNLRALFSVHSEPFTVVALRDAGIKVLDDLKGKRVNVGNPGSGQRGTMEVVMAAKGWTLDDFALANDLPADQQSLALCHERVQAIVYTVGHPNGSVGQAMGLCDAIIVEVRDPAIDKLVDENPYYAYTEVPGGIYVGSPDPITTFGVKATVVSTADVDADTIYEVVKAVFTSFERFRRMHPAFGELDKARMIRDGLSAPLHEGAIRYYREQGLM